ncbi:protease inhibitor I42 family protein [Anaerosacchariphilus polymeriproducens]|uniref:protease inhibitor I42 family protein n=1 Tax=Anaerosacchariphilus polymeriproducens TaxID=1812858 RepID=UPI00138FF0CD|nr:protease inhibitor I42 family protein [Anaerosacchariphilus polymeriproducens]
MHNNTLLIIYYPKNGIGQSYDDIEYIYNEYESNNQWFSQWCTKEKCESPERIYRRPGLYYMNDKNINVSIQEAIDLFHQEDRRSCLFNSITLSCPLVKTMEPFYTFTTEQGNNINIKAYDSEKSSYSNENCSNMLPTKVILKINEEKEIKIKSNETTGYRWYMIPDNSGVYEIVNDEYVPDFPIKMGSGGCKIFTIKGAREGIGNAVLQLYPPGNEGPVEEHYITIQTIS